ncbi:MAG TPA: hypothetical protein VL371_12825 [Gemmataceae bacterium]|nr:hypothetical protein [Gemmataceae bacterium]
MTRELILLSPYTPPTNYPLSLGADETAAWLHAWSALWHPAAITGAVGPPRVASPYDHEQPTAGHLYAVPESPPLYLSDDWDERVRQVGAAAFRSGWDRASTLANLKEALGQLGGDVAALDRDPAEWRPYFGLGLGYITVETLFDAMEHEHLLDKDAFWADLQSGSLQEAAMKLLHAREVVYPVVIHLLDFALPGKPDDPLPAAPGRRSPLNLIASAELLAVMPAERLDELRSAAGETIPDTDDPRLEVCGGYLLDRADALLPIESQLWNLRRGLARTRELVGAGVEVFARRTTASHPGTPRLLQHVGLSKALALAFDGARLPDHKAAVIQWPSADGRQVEAFARAPLPADEPETYFHLAHRLHQTIMNDSAAVLALLHRDRAAPDWYDDWLAVTELAPALGTWTTARRYFRDSSVGEYAPAATADEFSLDDLEPRVETAKASQAGGAPVSGFPRHLRRRRRLDSARTIAALHRALGGPFDAESHAELNRIEERIEREQEVTAEELVKAEQAAAAPLAERLLSRAGTDRRGLLLLNPCAFARRAAIEREGFAAVSPVGGPVRATQLDGETARLVIDLPALGFAWVPTDGGNVGATTPARRAIRLADERGVRNEFFDAEVDPVTGGLRALRDPRDRGNRIGQQLVWQPGSTMKAQSVRVTTTGPALGEVVSEGAIVDEQEAVLATFRQRFRAWLGRPLLELRIEIFPEKPPQGYPWHAYYGARFAWRDERATIVRGVCGAAEVTTHSRPVTPDFLELREGTQRTLLLPGGLPFHQRQGTRMLDVILIPEGESAHTFDLALGLDRDQPMQTAWGLCSPVVAIPVEKGPPQVGPSGWLFHLDVPNLLLTSLRAVPDAAAVTATLLECAGFAGSAELRCPRDPTSAAILDAAGERFQTLYTQGDAVQLDCAAHDLLEVRVDF